MFSPHSQDGLASTIPRLPPQVELPWRPMAEVAPNCPRCDSANTKFCYYNNYSLSQPRYFCKACRRYWTKGGSLRDVPVGGGCRRKRGRRSTTSTTAAVHSRGSHFSESQADPPRRQDPSHPVLMLSDVAIVSSSATDGASAIDLEELYAKYKNGRGTDLDDSAVMPSLPDADLDKDDAGFIRTSSESSSCSCQMKYNVVPLQLPTHQRIEEFNDEYFYSITAGDSTNSCVDWLTIPTSAEPAAGNYRDDQMMLDLPCGSPCDHQVFESVGGICHQKNTTTDIEYCGSSLLDYNYSS